MNLATLPKENSLQISGRQATLRLPGIHILLIGDERPHADTFPLPFCSRHRPTELLRMNRIPLSVSLSGDQEGWEAEDVHLDLYCKVTVLRATAFSLSCDWFKQALVSLSQLKCELGQKAFLHFLSKSLSHRIR